MGAIAILGFIVWAQMGLHSREILVINDRHMLETLLMYISDTQSFCKMLCISQSAGNDLVYYAICIVGSHKECPLQRHARWLNPASPGSTCNESFGLIGSSETRRDKSFSFLFTFSTDTHIQELHDFYNWFIGFSEGDGGFYYDHAFKRFYFKLRQKDAKVLYYVRRFLSFGSISKGKDGYFTYTVTSLNHIEVLINIFNGKLLLKKTNINFNQNWLVNYNQLYVHKNINYKGPGQFVGFNNAWLCGFTDADGSLSFHLQKDSSRKCGYRLRLKWYVDQSYEKEFFYTMGHVLEFGFIEKKYKSKDIYNFSKDAWRFKEDSFTHLCKVKAYFDNYKPRTTKLIVRFIRFSRVLNWVNKKEWQSRINEIKHLIVLNKRLNK